MIEQNPYKVKKKILKFWDDKNYKSDTCFPEKIHCNVALSPSTALGVFLQIPFSSLVALDSAMK